MPTSEPGWLFATASAARVPWNEESANWPDIGVAAFHSTQHTAERGLVSHTKRRRKVTPKQFFDTEGEPFPYTRLDEFSGVEHQRDAYRMAEEDERVDSCPTQSSAT